jgi:hypothetical protein
MRPKRFHGTSRAPVRILAGILALPGLFVCTISTLALVDHPSWPLAEWAVASLALAVFFGVAAVLGRDP